LNKDYKMKSILLLSAGFVLAANMTLASVTPSALAAAYQAKGYSSVHVTQGPNQIKVEAIRNHARVEVVYDASTGAILTQEQSDARGAKAASTVEVSATDEDFTEDASDDNGTDAGAKAETESEHEGGDHSGSGGGSDGAGHDGGDD
jgi:hypothetical protein